MKKMSNEITNENNKLLVILQERVNVAISRKSDVIKKYEFFCEKVRINKSRVKKDE
jgi:hypothetical protein